MRQPPKRMPMGTTPEQIKADLWRVFTLNGKLSEPIYRRHGIFSSSSMIRKFGSWNRCLEVNGLPTNYETKKVALLDDELAEFEPIEKPSRHKCPRCQTLHVAINYFCERCSLSMEQDVPEGWEVVAG